MDEASDSTMPALAPTRSGSAAQLERLADGILQPLHHLVGDVLGHDAGGDHDELVTTDPGDDVAGSSRQLETAADALEQLVAGLVAEQVVDRLEVVEIDEQDGHRLDRPRPSPSCGVSSSERLASPVSASWPARYSNLCRANRRSLTSWPVTMSPSSTGSADRLRISNCRGRPSAAPSAVRIVTSIDWPSLAAMHRSRAAPSALGAGRHGERHERSADDDGLVVAEQPGERVVDAR